MLTANITSSLVLVPMVVGLLICWVRAYRYFLNVFDKGFPPFSA